jgi:pimeloyl-ACP methyl ester carboxylesterase
MDNDDLVRREVDLPGRTLEFFERGSGEPLLLIHAGVFAAWFTPLARDAALDGFRVLETVRAGYGPTAPTPGRRLTVADHARDCAALLDSLRIRRAHVLGHSSGSVIALQLAVDRPDLVQSLVLVEPAILPALVPPIEAEGVRAALDSMTTTARAGADLATLFDTFMRQVCAADYRDVLRTALGPEGLQRAERDCGFFFREEVQAMGDWTFDHDIASRITQPALLVQGGESPPRDRAIFANLTAMLADAATATVEGTDHLLPLRDPSTLARITAEFAGRHATTAHA